MAQLITLEPFEYKSDSVHKDWPAWRQRFENFSRLQRVSIAIVTANLGADPPVAGEDTSMALAYLLHSGGSKIMDIYNASPNEPVLNYVTFKAIIDARLVAANAQINDLHFRSSKIQVSETLADYAIRLRQLAVSANIANANLDAQILSVIRANTDDTETKLKCLDDTITLTSLLAWKRAQELKEACLNTIDKPAYSVNNVDVDQRSNKKCFNCGYSLAHKTCPAKGSTCYNCNKLNHFSSVCRNGQNNHTTYNYRQRQHPNNNNQHNDNQRSTNNSQNRTFSNASRNAIRNNLRNKGHGNNNENTNRNTVNNIEELSEDEVLAQFENFYRNNLQNAQQDDVCVISHCGDEIINEMSTIEQNKCPHTFLNIGSKCFIAGRHRHEPQHFVIVNIRLTSVQTIA